MPQIVEVIGVGNVEFPDGMSKEEMAAALNKLSKPSQTTQPDAPIKPTPQQIERMATQQSTQAAIPTAVPKPAPAQPQGFNVLEASGAALMRQQSERQAKKQAEIPFEQLYSDPENMKKIQDYATARFGKAGQPEAGESAEEYTKRWATHMRMMGTGNLISATQELQYLNNATDAEKLKAKEAYDLFDKTAGYFSGAGQKGIKPVFDVLGSIISDPTTAISLGAGKLATSAFMKEAVKTGVKQAAKTNVGKLAAVPLIEGTGAAASDVTQQKIELTGEAARLKQLEGILPTLSPEDQARFAPDVDALRQKVEEGVSGKRAAASAALGAALGTAETGLLIKGGKAVEGKGAVAELDTILKQRATKFEPAPKVEVPPKDATEKSVEDAYDIFEGRKLLDKQGDPTSVAEMQVRNDINQTAAKVAKEVWTRVPDLAPQADQKISDAVKNVFMNIDKIDNVVLEDSLAKAGITAEEFARMNRTTVGDAGRTLQAYSVLARIQNKLKSIDPAAAKEVDDMYGKRNALVDAFSGLYSGAQRLDRELKALMVSQVATTMRNGMSSGTIVTFGAASEALESALYRVGKSAVEVATGKPVTGTFTGGLKSVYDDAVRTTFYLGQQGLSSDVADALLSSSPALRQRILKTTGEAGTEQLSKLGQYANKLNTAQDAFFRKAIFVSNVEKQLNRVGLDMYDILAQNKNIPFDVLNNATEEALAATMSKMPTKGPLFYGVKFIESVPIVGSTVIPFPRFMANALTWTYKHSPMNAFNGSIDVARGAALLKQGDDTGNAYLAKGLENVSKSAVGTAAIYAAYKYREANQGTNWFELESDDGSKVDIRALWPIGPFMAMGDWLVKIKNKRTDEFKTKELVEAVSGFKAPAGTYAWLGDKFTEAAAKFAGSEEADNTKLETFFGEWAGEYFGRALIPAAQISDIIGAIDRDETLPRDAYQIPKGEEGFGASFKQQLMKRTPVVKQELPVYQPSLREEAAFNDSGPLKMLSGITVKGRPTELEAEVERLNIDFRKVFTGTGDRVIDASARQKMAPLIMEVFDQVKNTDYYQTASKDGQKIALQNLLSWAQKNAKEIATNEDMAAAFDKGDQSRIFAVKYDKLPPEVKRETAALYKETTGEDLATTKDYMTALAMSASIRSRLKFAAGGLVGDVAGKLVKTAVKKSSTDLLKEMQEAAAKKAVTEPSPAIDQTANMLMGKKPVLPKPAAKPVPAPTAAPTEQALPTPPEKIIEAPTPSEPIFTAPTPSKAFADEDYIKGEEAMLELYSPEQLKSWKIANPEDYENNLHSFTGMAKGLKYSEMPPPPFAKKTDEAAESLVDEVEYDIDGNPVSVGGKAVVKKAEPVADEYGVDPMYLSGDVNNITGNFSVNARNKAVAAIKETREDSFFKLRNNDKFATIDDEVLGTVLGDYRYSRGVELNPKDPEMLADAMKLAGQYQKRLDTLREKYKDVPPVKLFHGQGAKEDIEPIKKSGFADPTTRDEFHSEMMVGAPSFTKDLNLGFRGTPFGGTNPQNYVVTEIPYADYVFSKINMAPEKYDRKDMNTILRAVTGAPGVVRPIGLPRAGFLETEDMMLEAEKLRVKGRDAKLRSAEKDVAQVLETGGKGLARPTMKREEETVSEYMKLARTSTNPKEKMKLAYMSYQGIKDLMNSYLDMATATSTKAGLGQQYQAAINTFADYSGIQRQMREIGDILWDGGAKQKAQNLYELSDKLKKFQQSEPEISTAVGESKRTKPLDEVRKFVPKLAKGGFIKRR